MNQPSSHIAYTNWASPLGNLVIARNADGLAGVWFDGQAHFSGIETSWLQAEDDPLLLNTITQLSEWFGGTRRAFELPLAPAGTAFQQSVWREIARVGFGETRSYGEVANALGKAGASRAVGAATGRNPLTIIVPCHRLMGASGALTGYAGGLARKQFLLAFESGRDTRPFALES
ncbi:methylated-DNA--[protein]-cysteine S-methyltransferase [Burkholderiaceae bacterium DAT-1]|nr:methylated-DNA--[protein]-cysteine S-methyltransferase [Burkholderiaceae bacterium DAT-1]